MTNIAQEFSSVFTEQHVRVHANQGITICHSLNNIHGFTIAKDILASVLTQTSVLYLSGGKTPKEFYKELAQEEIIIPGAVGLIDERFGPKWHEKSNEKMIKDSGLIRYFEMRGIPTHLLLQNLTRTETARNYDELLRSLQVQYKRHVGILGIGIDGHTAGIARNHDEFKNPMFDSAEKSLLVSDFDDPHGMEERVSMTFTGLSMLDLNIILVFGPEKGTALEKLFSDGTEEDIPARFFKRPDIASRTLLITDQAV